MPQIEHIPESKGVNTPKLLIIHTGGTFGMQFGPEGKQLKDFDFLTLKETIPELKRLNVSLSIKRMENLIDSSDMTPNYWVELAKTIEKSYHKFNGFIILHGTDTMAYTASALSFMLQNLSKPVVLTGALIPLGEVRNDARENLITSIEIALMREQSSPVFQEVMICFDNKLLRGNRASKSDTDHFDSFTSPNYPYLAEIGASITVNKDNLLKKTVKELVVFTRLEEEVFLLKIFPGLSEKALNHLLNLPIKGLVLETFGNGNVPSEQWFYSWLERMIAKGISIINVSQSLAGTVLQGKYQASKYLSEIGVLDGKDMTAEAAITKLMICLNLKEKIQSVLISSIAGEISN